MRTYLYFWQTRTKRFKNKFFFNLHHKWTFAFLRVWTIKLQKSFYLDIHQVLITSDHFHISMKIKEDLKAEKSENKQSSSVNYFSLSIKMSSCRVFLERKNNIIFARSSPERTIPDRSFPGVSVADIRSSPGLKDPDHSPLRLRGPYDSPPGLRGPYDSPPGLRGPERRTLHSRR